MSRKPAMKSARFDRTTPKNATFKDLLVVWNVLCGDSPEQYEFALGGDKRVLQRRDRLIGPNDDLGLTARLICLQEWLGCSQQNLFVNAKRLYANAEGLDISDESLPSTASKQRMLRLTTRESPSVLDSVFKKGITIWVNESIRSGDPQAPLSELSVEQIFDHAYNGTSAIEQFWQVVHEPEIMPQPLSNRFSEKHLAKNLAIRAVAQVQERESQQMGESISPVVLNVVCNGAWGRASAFGHYLSEHYSQSEPDRPVLVLPLCRQGQSRASQDIPHYYDVLDFPHLLHWLSRFYEQGNIYNTDNDEFRSYSGPISDEIQNIRLKMMTRPVTIIFDGVSTGQRHRTPLERVIADDDMFWLLSRLTDAPISSINEKSLEENYRKNRFVLLTDEAISDDYYRKTQVQVSESDAVSLPRIDSDSRYASIGEMRLSNTKLIKQYIRSNPALGAIQSDSVFRLLDSILTVVKEGELDLESTIEQWYFAKPSHNKKGDSWLIRQCAVTLMESLDALNPAFTTLLGLVSYAPDGLRPASVKRLALRLNALSSEHADLLPGIQPDDVDATLEALLKLLKPILRQRGHDSFAGIDDVRLAMFSQSHAIDDGRGKSKLRSGSNVIQFRMPQIMSVIRAYMTQYRAERFHLAHRLLTEEAVVQQTTALSQVDVSSSPSIRSWRRLFSVIYHGLQSLPLEQDDKGYALFGKNNIAHSQLSSHGDGHKYWMWLYFFWYRRMLERPPAWNLSRTYGLDGLKAELLECFDKPWKLWPKQLPQKYNFENAIKSTKGLFTPRMMNKENTQYFISQRRSLARSRIALSQIPEASQAIDDIRTLLSIHANSRESNEWSKNSGDNNGNSSSWTMDSAYERRVVLMINKQVFDTALLTVDDSVNHIFSELLHEFCAEIYSDLSDYLSSQCKEHFRYLNSNSEEVWSSETAHSNSALANRVIDKLIADGWNVGEIGSLADIMFRLGERHGISAEILGSTEGSCEQHDTDVMSPPTAGSHFHRTSGLISGYVVFELAEALRLQLFQRFPHSNDYFASGHSGRQMIRTAVALENIHRRSRKGSQTGIGTYGHRAILGTKTLARHMFRYPRERASLSIIEASLFRTLGQVGTEIENLRKSEELLRQAEPVVLGLGRTTRVRLRLALERAKVNQSIACTMAYKRNKNDSEVKRYMALSKLDIQYLERNHYNLPFWEALFQRQSTIWESTVAELNSL